MRKRIKRKTDKFNKITSMQERTQDRKMSITLRDVPLTDKTNNEEGKNDNVIERTESEENLLLAIKETENLWNQLKEKKEELENNKKKYENDLALINQDIKDKTTKLENVSNNTKKLLNDLNLLNKEINEGYNKVNLFQVAKNIKIDFIQNAKLHDKKRIDQGKKIILMNNKIIDRYKIQKEKLEKIIEEDKSFNINYLKAKLEELNKNEKNITKEVEDLRLIKKNHEKKCIQTNEELDILLERTTKEFNDEYNLKNNNNKAVSYQRNDSYPSIQSLPKIIKGKNLAIQTSDNNSIQKNKPNKEERNCRSLTNIFGDNYLMEKDLKELKEKIRNDMKKNINQKTKCYITSYTEQKKDNNKKDDNIIEKQNLFSRLEKDMLSQIIPKECLNIFQNKYKTIDKERMQMKEKILLNKTKKKINEEKSQLLFITEKKDINIIKKNVELSSKIIATKKKIKIIMKEIKSTQKGLKDIIEKYNLKKEENDKLKNHWISLNDDIKNKKIIVKKGETISKNELDDLNKWGNHIDSPNINNSNNEETCDNNSATKRNKPRKSEG